MVKTYRGKEIDMISLAKKNEKNIALGNVLTNGRFDVLGKGGKVEKTREEVLAEWYATHTTEKEVTNLKVNDTKELEKEIVEAEIDDKPIKAKSKKQKPLYEDITDEEKKTLEKEGQ